MTRKNEDIDDFDDTVERMEERLHDIANKKRSRVPTANNLVIVERGTYEEEDSNIGSYSGSSFNSSTPVSVKFEETPKKVDP